MHPDQVVRPQHGHKVVGEQRAHPLIGCEAPAGEFYEIEPVMKERPQGGVTKAVVIAIMILTGEVHSGVCQPVGFGHSWLCRWLSGYLAAPTEPYSSGLAQSVENSRDQAAAGLLALLR